VIALLAARVERIEIDMRDPNSWRVHKTIIGVEPRFSETAV
jgi:hypothetical protein